MPVGAAVASGAGSLVGGIMGADASRSAANKQADAANSATALQRQGLQAQAYATAPGRNIGTTALYQLASMLGIDPRTAFPNGMPGATESAPASGGGWMGLGQRSSASGPTGYDSTGLIPQLPTPGAPGAEFGSLMHTPTLGELQLDPAYGFRLSQNLGAIDNSAAARGMQLSGSNLKDLSRFSQDYASQEYGNAYNRYQGHQNDIFNRYASLAGIGQTAAANTGNAAMNFGAQAGSNAIGAGNALAAGGVGAANALSQGIGGASNAAQNYYLMQALFNQKP